MPWPFVESSNQTCTARHVKTQQVLSLQVVLNEPPLNGKIDEPLCADEVQSSPMNLFSKEVSWHKVNEVNLS
jgi:hypothetical protein